MNYQRRTIAQSLRQLPAQPLHNDNPANAVAHSLKAAAHYGAPRLIRRQ